MENGQVNVHGRGRYNGRAGPGGLQSLEFMVDRFNKVRQLRAEQVQIAAAPRAVITPPKGRITKRTERSTYESKT